MKYNFRYDVDDELDDNEFRVKVKTHKHFNKEDEEENTSKQNKKEQTKKLKKSRKEKYNEIEDE